eukprot:517032-Hanusia_phi.AAC.4
MEMHQNGELKKLLSDAGALKFDEKLLRVFFACSLNLSSNLCRSSPPSPSSRPPRCCIQSSAPPADEAARPSAHLVCPALRPPSPRRREHTT